MTQSICILGRQPALGLAELESLYGAGKIKPAGPEAALLDMDPSEIKLDQIGGTIKVCKLLTPLPYTDLAQLVDYIIDVLPKHIGYVPEGKIRFGLSVYGIKASPAEINRVGLSIKKVIKGCGRSVRIVPNKQTTLNSAQILHNQLVGPTGMELVLISQGDHTLLAQTVQVQDIDAYAARDQERPKRDARIGMLPPKLAQIIINLAIGNEADEKLHDWGTTILDPFCGTGVIMQEAWLMGYNAFGSDIDPRMVEYSGANVIDWLSKKYSHPGTIDVSEGDATSYKWNPGRLDVIASETYLGRPFSTPPPPEVLAKVIQDVSTIHKKFLQNVARQTKPGLRMCIAVPAWKTKNGFKHLPVLDSLKEMGYTRTSFTHVSNRDLIYHRPEQIVARELVVLQRN